MATRIYTVQGQDKTWLVESATASAAIRAVVGKQYSARPATPKEVAQLVAKGATVLNMEKPEVKAPTDGL